MTAQEKALIEYGIDAQLLKLTEECVELAAAALHVRDRGAHALPELFEEIADVEIILDQMRIHFGDDRIDVQRSKKLTRLEGRLGLFKVESSGSAGQPPRPVYVDDVEIESVKAARLIFGAGISLALHEGRDYKGHKVRYADA